MCYHHHSRQASQGYIILAIPAFRSRQKARVLRPSLLTLTLTLTLTITATLHSEFQALSKGLCFGSSCSPSPSSSPSIPNPDSLKASLAYPLINMTSKGEAPAAPTTPRRLTLKKAALAYKNAGPAKDEWHTLASAKRKERELSVGPVIFDNNVIITQRSRDDLCTVRIAGTAAVLYLS